MPVLSSQTIVGRKYSSTNIQVSKGKVMRFLSTISGAILFAATFAYSGFAQLQFPTEQQAEQHCPKDVVVWLNVPTGVYHFKRERWYGRTKSGAFVC